MGNRNAFKHGRRSMHYIEGLERDVGDLRERLRQMLLNGMPQADGRLLVERYSVERAWEAVLRG